MSESRTISAEEEPILNSEDDDTINDSEEMLGDDDCPTTSKRTRKEYDVYKTYDTISEAKADIEGGLLESTWICCDSRYVATNQ